MDDYLVSTKMYRAQKAYTKAKAEYKASYEALEKGKNDYETAIKLEEEAKKVYLADKTRENGKAHSKAKREVIAAWNKIDVILDPHYSLDIYLSKYYYKENPNYYKYDYLNYVNGKKILPKENLWTKEKKAKLLLETKRRQLRTLLESVLLKL